MHGNIRAGAVAASNAPDRTGSEITITDQTDSDGENWFSDLARGLLPKDSGFILHLQTGFEERTCYRYASGERKPPGYFIRELLRSDQGWQWLCGLMEGSNAEWWTETKRARAIKDALDNLPA